jgi:hypothetical protein
MPAGHDIDKLLELAIEEIGLIGDSGNKLTHRLGRIVGISCYLS